MKNEQNNFKKLLIWQKSRVLAAEVYRLCQKLPVNENFGLISQMKRSSVSIPSNVAEGYRRWNTKEYLQFLGISAGSAAELETQLIIVSDVYGFDTLALQEMSIEVQKLLTATRNSLRSKLSYTPTP
jgi:four helix bundle protein